MKDRSKDQLNDVSERAKTASGRGTYAPTDGLAYDPEEPHYWDEAALHRETARVFDVCASNEPEETAETAKTAEKNMLSVLSGLRGSIFFVIMIFSPAFSAARPAMLPSPWRGPTAPGTAGRRIRPRALSLTSTAPATDSHAPKPMS